MPCYITPDGNYYEGDYVAEGSVEVPQRPDSLKHWDGHVWVLDTEKADAEKTALLVIGRANREIILNRLNGHRNDVEDDLAAAVAASDEPGIELQQVNLNAIRACRASLKAMFNDPRVVAAVDGEVKAAVTAVYAEIAQALYLTAPSVFVAFKGLDEL